MYFSKGVRNQLFVLNDHYVVLVTRFGVFEVREHCEEMKMRFQAWQSRFSSFDVRGERIPRISNYQDRFCILEALFDEADLPKQVGLFEADHFC